MNWDAAGAIGEILGAIAVLVTLLAIYFQIRQSQVLERESAQRHLLEQSRSFMKSLSSDEGLFNDVRACLHDYSSQAPFLQQRFHGWGFDLLFIIEQAFYQHREGLINQSSFNGFTTAMLTIIKCPGGRQWWDSVARPLLGKEAGDYLQERVDEGLDEIPMFYELATFLSPIKENEHVA